MTIVSEVLGVQQCFRDGETEMWTQGIRT